MKKFALTILVVFATISAFGQKTDFVGVWKIDLGKSVLPANLPTMNQITIAIKGDSLITERVYDGGGQDMPFQENLALDGSESKITIYEMPRKAKASFGEQDTVLNLESTTTFNGQDGPTDFICKETWKVDKAANTLAINYINKVGEEEETGVFLYTKAEAAK